MLLTMQSKLLNFLPAAEKQLLKCCACSEGGRREMNAQRRGPAGARALVAMHMITARKNNTTFNFKTAICTENYTTPSSPLLNIYILRNNGWFIKTIH